MRVHFYHCTVKCVSTFLLFKKKVSCLFYSLCDQGAYIVRVGDWDQDIPDIGEKEFVIQTVNFHPDFNIGAYLSNDIALLTIKVKIISKI